MNKKEHLPEQSKIRSLLIQIELALKENRLEEALAILQEIKLDEMTRLSLKELQAVGNLINYIKILAEDKRSEIINQLKTIQASRKYL